MLIPNADVQKASARVSFALVASGGGALGLSEAAAIDELRRNGVAFAASGGASAGTINSAGLAFGLTNLATLWEELLSSEKLEDWKMPGPLRPLGILQGPGHGMIKGKAIRAALQEKLGSETRVGDSPIPLRAIVSNLSLGTKQTICSTVEKHKRLRVVDVVMGSLAVPFVIDAQQIDPTSPVLYSDGGIANNVPSAMWDDIEERTLVLRFREPRRATKIDSLKRFASAVFKISRQAAEDEISRKPDTIDVPIPVLGESLDFSQSPTDCARLREGGKRAARAWLAAHGGDNRGPLKKEQFICKKG